MKLKVVLTKLLSKTIGGLYIILLLFYYKSTNAQQIFFNAQSSINTPIDIDKRIIFDRQDTVTYYTTSQADSMLQIFKVGSDKVFNFSISKKLKKKMKDAQISSFCFIENQWLHLIIFNKIITFKIINNRLVQYAIMPCWYDRIVYTGNDFFLLTSYNSHQSVRPLNNSIGIAHYNIYKKMIDYQYYHEPTNLIYTHLEQEQITYLNGKFAIHVFYPYKIIFLDKSLKQYTEINDPNFVINNAYKNALHSIDSANKIKDRNLKDLIYKLQDVDINIKRLSKIYFLNDSLFLAGMKDSNVHAKYILFDVWRYTNNSWERIIQNQFINQSNLPEDNKDFKSPPPINFTSTFGAYFYNDICFTKSVWYPDFFKQESFESLITRVKEYFKNNKMYTSINIYKWEIK